MVITNLAFDSEADNFTAAIADAGNQYELTIVDFTANDEAGAAALANNICLWLQTNIDSIKVYAAKQLTSLKNESWLEEDEQPISETSFADRIELNSILAFSNGSFKVFFDDGDIFWGHSVVVDVDENFGFDGAGVMG